MCYPGVIIAYSKLTNEKYHMKSKEWGHLDYKFYVLQVIKYDRVGYISFKRFPLRVEVI